jgi:hypothetical protein
MGEGLKMKEILAEFAFLVGLVLAFAKLLEFMLTAHQKDWLSDRTLVFWNWLVSQRRGRFISILWTAKFQFFILGYWMISQIFRLLSNFGDSGSLK